MERGGERAHTQTQTDRHTHDMHCFAWGCEQEEMDALRRECEESNTNIKACLPQAAAGVAAAGRGVHTGVCVSSSNEGSAVHVCMHLHVPLYVNVLSCPHIHIHTCAHSLFVPTAFSGKGGGVRKQRCR